MRIWHLHELGEPAERLRLETVDPPEAAPGHALIEVEAVGLSFPDVLQCRGEYQVKPPLPFTPGGEAAGRIVDPGDSGFDVGTRVMAMGAGLREIASVAVGSLWPIPDSLAPEKAAAIPVNYGTTWFALHDRARLAEGETLLVTGAAGGVGSAAIQLGRAAGARIIAVAGGEEKVARCRELGADEVIDHRETPDFVDLVRELTDGRGVDVAYEAVGGEVFTRVRRCMAWDGRLLVIGFVAGIPDAPMNHVLLKNYSIVGVHWGASLGRNPESLSEQMAAVLDLTPSGVVDPLIYPPFSFEEAAGALQALADRQTYGKAVVSVT